MGQTPALGLGTFNCLFYLLSGVLVFPLTCCDAAGGGGSALLRRSPDDKISEERRASEGGPASPGPRQNVLRGVERWL